MSTQVDQAYAVLDHATNWCEVDDPNDYGEASVAAAELHDSAIALARAVLAAYGVDVSSSVSVQHYSDTGRYLTQLEVSDGRR